MKLKPAGCRLWTAVNSSGGWCWPPRAFGRTEVFNTGFVIMVLNHWDEGRRAAWELMRDVQAQIKDLTGMRLCGYAPGPGWRAEEIRPANWPLAGPGGDEAKMGLAAE